VGIVMYTKPGCPYCAAARNDLVARGVEFEEIDVYATPGARDIVARLTDGTMVVPVLVEDRDVHVGFGGG